MTCISPAFDTITQCLSAAASSLSSSPFGTGHLNRLRTLHDTLAQDRDLKLQNATRQLADVHARRDEMMNRLRLTTLALEVFIHFHT